MMTRPNSHIERYHCRTTHRSTTASSQLAQSPQFNRTIYPQPSSNTHTVTDAIISHRYVILGDDDTSGGDNHTVARQGVGGKESVLTPIRRRGPRSPSTPWGGARSRRRRRGPSTWPPPPPLPTPPSGRGEGPVRPRRRERRDCACGEEPTVARREGSMALVVAVAVAGARGEARSDFFFPSSGWGRVLWSGRNATGSLYHIRSRRGERVVLAASR